MLAICGTAVSAADEYWAFQSPSRPELPAAKDDGRAQNPIDRFVRARLEQEGLQPSPRADRRTLFRRLSLDLTGLPPTKNQIDVFLADTEA